MKQKLIDLLLEMLRSYGYQIAACDFCDIVCRRGDYELFVMCSPERDLDLLGRFTEDVNGRNGLFVTMRKFRGCVDTEAYLRDTGIVIWDRDELASNIGKFRRSTMNENELTMLVGNSILNEIESQSYRETFLKNGAGSEMPSYDGCFYEASANNGPESALSSAHAEPSDAELFSDNGIIIAEENEMPAQRISQPSQFAQPAQQPAQSSQFMQSSQSSVFGSFSDEVSDKPSAGMLVSEIRVSSEKALSIASSSIGDASNAILKFIPYWKYRYLINVDKMFCGERIRISGNGEGLVNSVNGQKDDIEIGSIRMMNEMPNVIYEIKSGKIESDEVRLNVVSELSRKYMRDVSSNETNAQVIISQSKVFKPSESDFDIDVKQIYVPVWEVSGRKKNIEINAYNGKPLETPADDGVEFV